MKKRTEQDITGVGFCGVSVLLRIPADRMKMTAWITL
ncbi:hypothetical protein SAMN05444274_10348 [Mariniphaga anaerophila]|uniref:Uncharacterized protein n=1 Tax=Mariniphaga anaerophila TaxID=1484053 RepID=A0A1M4XLL5_9BACT|nr:hypothetical protein SAMN05444274_10348 [Mariniphaga anaerophila]